MVKFRKEIFIRSLLLIVCFMEIIDFKGYRFLLIFFEFFYVKMLKWECR